MKKKSKRAFPQKLSRPEKRTAGRTGATETPLHIRTTGLTLDEDTEARIRERITRQLGKFAPSIERMSVRLRDVNGPRGGMDTLCTIKIVLSGNPSVVAEEVGEETWPAFMAASKSAERSVRRVLDRRGSRKAARSAPARRKKPPPSTSDDGSLIGRRVGRSQANLERAAARPEKKRRDAYVDTAELGLSESDRRAGAAGTAARNTKLNRAGLTSALEDSASGNPSRKSTRGSANRSKRDSNLKRRQTRRTRAPKARAERAQAKKKGGRRK